MYLHTKVSKYNFDEDDQYWYIPKGDWTKNGIFDAGHTRNVSYSRNPETNNIILISGSVKQDTTQAEGVGKQYKIPEDWWIPNIGWHTDKLEGMTDYSFTPYNLETGSMDQNTFTKVSNQEGSILVNFDPSDNNFLTVKGSYSDSSQQSYNVSYQQNDVSKRIHMLTGQFKKKDGSLNNPQVNMAGHWNLRDLWIPKLLWNNDDGIPQPYCLVNGVISYDPDDFLTVSQKLAGKNEPGSDKPKPVEPIPVEPIKPSPDNPNPPIPSPPIVVPIDTHINPSWLKDYTRDHPNNPVNPVNPKPKNDQDYTSLIVIGGLLIGFFIIGRQ